MGFWKQLWTGDDENPAPPITASDRPEPPPPPDPPLPEPSSGVQRRHRARRWRPPHDAPTSTTHGDARFADPRRDAAAMKDALGGKTGVWFGANYTPGWLPSYEEQREISYQGDRHLLTIAPTGSGKGSCAMIPNLLMQHELSIVCIDPKGQNAAVTARARREGGRKVYCLNPFGLHTGEPWNLPQHRFNPLAHLSIDQPTVVADAASLAQALIVTESRTQPYFDNAARDLVKALILHALATKGNKATLLDVRAWLGQPMQARTGDDPSFTKTIFEMSRSPYGFIRESASRFLGSARSIDEVVQSAGTQTEFLSDPCIAATLGGSDFRMLDFKDRPTTLYIILPDTYIDAYSRFLRVITIAALDGLRSRPGGVRTLVMLDEFPRLGHLAAVENAFALARGYNVQVWPFVQDLSQLKAIYGERWESFVANAGMVQWFTPNDPFTAQYLSRRIGRTTINTMTTNSQSSSGQSIAQTGVSYNGGRSRTVNEQEAAADFMSPQDLYDLPDYLQICTLAGFKFPILATREHYFEWADVMTGYRDNCDPDPYEREPKA